MGAMGSYCVIRDPARRRGSTFLSGCAIGRTRLFACETVAEAGKGIAESLRYFNEERPHQGLDNRTPDDVFYKRKPLPKTA